MQRDSKQEEIEGYDNKGLQPELHNGHCSYVVCVFTSGHPKLTVFIKLIKSLLHFF